MHFPRRESSPPILSGILIGESMARRIAIEEKLMALAVIERGDIGKKEQAELRKALKGANNLLAARAATVIGRRGLLDLLDILPAAFDRFMHQPARSDKGCRAKVAIVETWKALAVDQQGRFIQGLRHIQLEPVWGGSEDTADVLRVRCGEALLQLGAHELRLELPSLLTDRSFTVRRAAVAFLEAYGDSCAELLLRMKILIGDDEPAVVADALAALVGVAPDPSLEFVARFLDSGDEILCNASALALASSRLPEAFELLVIHRSGSIDSSVRRNLLLPIALTRQAAAFDYLLEVLLDEHQEHAETALDALKIYGDDPDARCRIEAVLRDRGGQTLARLYQQLFSEWL